MNLNIMLYCFCNLTSHNHVYWHICYLQDNKNVWKVIIGKHNLTSPVSSYSRPEIMTKSQSYFFTHSVKTISVTLTAKGITAKQLLIGAIGDQVRFTLICVYESSFLKHCISNYVNFCNHLQVLALDKRLLDPRRTANPTPTDLEDGIIPLTDSLPINPQVC